MTAYRAAGVCPIDLPPIRRGVVEIEGGRIVAVGQSGSQATGQPGNQAIRDLGNVALLPGLINAHTHLELSWLRDRVPPANRFTDWVKTLVAIRRGTEQIVTPEIVGPIHEAITELQGTGTAAVGDITNSLAAVEPMKDAGLRAWCFTSCSGSKSVMAQ